MEPLLRAGVEETVSGNHHPNNIVTDHLSWFERTQVMPILKLSVTIFVNMETRTFATFSIWDFPQRVLYSRFMKIHSNAFWFGDG